MRKILAWTKANPINVAALLVVVAALAMVVYVILVGTPFVNSVNARVQGDLKKIDGYVKYPVKVPTSQPGHDDDKTLAINPTFIKQLQELNSKFRAQSDAVSQLISTRNKEGHEETCPGVLPESPKWEAKQKFSEAFKRILIDPNNPPATDTYPWSLRAGMPPKAADLNETIVRTRAAFERGMRHNPPPTRQEQDLLVTRLRKVVDDALIKRARGIQIYAQTDLTGAAPAAAMPALASDFPIVPVPTWLQAAVPPQATEIWEAQTELWVIQDIMTAIGLTNNAYTLTGENGKRQLKPVANPSDVTTAPIKHLLLLRPLPGYVGVDTGAAAGPGGPAVPFFGPGPGSDGGPPGGMPPGVPGAGPRPMAPGAPAVAAAGHGDDFSLSPTGRRSYKGPALYDVKHVVVSVVIDVDHIPDFMDNLGRVNFMSVLKVRTTAIDSYEEMKKGFFYGTQSCVRLDLLIETLWFRDWTKDLMPQKIREDLGVVLPATPASGVSVR